MSSVTKVLFAVLAAAAFVTPILSQGQRASSDSVQASRHSLIAPPPVATSLPADVLETVASGMFLDPFRLHGLASANGGQIRGEATSATQDMIPASAPPVPPTLAGIVGGPPWVAILRDVPGHNGSAMLAEGDSLGGVHVLRITGNAVDLRASGIPLRLTLNGT
jgi:hypothetical protein